MLPKPISFSLPFHLKCYQYQSKSHVDNISAFIQLKGIIFTRLKLPSFPFTLTALSEIHRDWMSLDNGIDSSLFCYFFSLKNKLAISSAPGSSKDSQIV